MSKIIYDSYTNDGTHIKAYLIDKEDEDYTYLEINDRFIAEFFTIEDTIQVIELFKQAKYINF